MPTPSNKTTHAAELARERTRRIRELLRELPPYVGDFMRALESTTSALTRLAYAFDLRIFFTYLCQEAAFVRPNERLERAKLPAEVTLDELRQLTARDIECYLSYLTLYEKPVETAHSIRSVQVENGALGKERKLASLRSFLKYCYTHDLLPENVGEKVSFPKKLEKPIIRLEPDEVARLLDEIDSGASLTPHQQAFHKKTRLRDIAIITLLLGTGIRLSECVGLNRSDLNFEIEGFRITRKGGNQVILYMPRETVAAIQDYLVERDGIQALPGHEDALFLSLQRKRIAVRAVQDLVKKYAALAAPLTNISPHKLRSTYGTQLYRQTGDIYLVADVLGHSDVNTTRRHYASMSDENRRRAARVTVLRDDAPEPAKD